MSAKYALINDPAKWDGIGILTSEVPQAEFRMGLSKMSSFELSSEEAQISLFEVCQCSKLQLSLLSK